MKTKQNIEEPLILNSQTWMSMFKPIDNVSRTECGLTLEDRSTIVFDHTNKDDLAAIKAAHPSTLWTIVEGDSGDWYIVNGFRVVNREGYLITRIGIGEGNIDVPVMSDTDADLGFSESNDGLVNVGCSNGCSSVSHNPILAYMFESKFSHYYCSYCSDTCR